MFFIGRVYCSLLFEGLAPASEALPHSWSLLLEFFFLSAQSLIGQISCKSYARGFQIGISLVRASCGVFLMHFLVKQEAQHGIGNRNQRCKASCFWLPAQVFASTHAHASQ